MVHSHMHSAMWKRYEMVQCTSWIASLFQKKNLTQHTPLCWSWSAFVYSFKENYNCLLSLIQRFCCNATFYELLCHALCILFFAQCHNVSCFCASFRVNSCDENANALYFLYILFFLIQCPYSVEFLCPWSRFCADLLETIQSSSHLVFIHSTYPILQKPSSFSIFPPVFHSFIHKYFTIWFFIKACSNKIPVLPNDLIYYYGQFSFPLHLAFYQIPFHVSVHWYWV